MVYVRNYFNRAVQGSKGAYSRVSTNRRNYGVNIVKKAVKKIKDKAFHKKVLKVINTQVETKQAYLTQTPTDFNSAINGTGDALKIIPNISKTVNDNGRIGDQLRARTLNIRAIVQMLPQGLGQGDGVRKLAARIIICSPKGYPNWVTAQASATTWQSQMLKKGGTVVGFTGDISDLFAPINTDCITCHYNKVVYFNQSTYAQASATGLVAFDQSHLLRFLNIKLKMKNRLFKYDDSVDGGLTPTNQGYFMCLGYAFTDGTSPDTLSTRVRLQYDVIFNFEDA